MLRDLLRFFTAVTMLGAFVAAVSLLGGFRDGAEGGGGCSSSPLACSVCSGWWIG